MLHYEEGELTDEEAESFILYDDKRKVMSLDYIKGRACKLTVFKIDKKLYIHDQWFDHTEADLNLLLSIIGITR